jgi:hypothetical protein
MTATIARRAALAATLIVVATATGQAQYLPRVSHRLPESPIAREESTLPQGFQVTATPSLLLVSRSDSMSNRGTATVYVVVGGIFGGMFGYGIGNLVAGPCPECWFPDPTVVVFSTAGAITGAIIGGKKAARARRRAPASSESAGRTSP